MAGKDYLKGHASTSKAPGNDTAWSGESPGPYIGVVMNNIDPLRMGRLQVNIPSLSKTNDPISGNLVTCEYLSPFYGAKDVRHSIPGSTDYKDSQHSYGFWAVPPDIGTRVLVIFAEGKMDQAFWIGCVPEPMTNQMTPGIASSEKTWDKTDGGPAGQLSSDVDKQQTYGSTNVPAGEVNRTVKDLKPQQFNTLRRPIHPFAETLLKQGLSADDIRGNTSSSARRETPSNVFGISTPGRKDTTTTKVNVGTKDSTRQDYVTRMPGHTFVMDDGDEEGENQLIRLRTASGHQLLMHDTEGVVYIANGSGKAFIEMNADGKVSIYATDGISMRTEGDFNLHSDRNIQFHAKEKIKFTAEEDVVLNAEKYIYAMGQSGILNASHKGSVRHYAKDGITSFTDGPQLHGAKGRIDLAGSQVHFNSVPARATWGPSWMKPDHDKIQIIAKEGEIDIEAYGPIDEGKPSKLENRTTVRDTTIGRGDFVNNDDPNYKQPPDPGPNSTDGGYGGREFYNAWDELEAFIGPNGDGLTAEGKYETISSPSLDTRLRLLINELGVVTPFNDKKNGVGNMAEKKAEYFKGVKERQKVGLPDAVGGVFVTHEPWNRGVKPVKRIKDPQFDPYYKSPSLGLGNFDNEWVEWEALNTLASTNEQLERRNELTEKLGIAKFSETGSYGSNVAEAKAEYYEGLKERQKGYENLSVSEQNEILGRNN